MARWDTLRVDRPQLRVSLDRPREVATLPAVVAFIDPLSPT